jgi:hypothetical protein
VSKVLKSVASKKQIVNSTKRAAKHAVKQAGTEMVDTHRTLTDQHTQRAQLEATQERDEVTDQEGAGAK